MNKENSQPNEKKHNYFYKITNLINGKYYYGIHSTNKIPNHDNYWGSGKAIKEAIKKHGKNNFKKEIIADYPTRKEVSEHEKMVVTFEIINLDECYNCRVGGDDFQRTTGRTCPEDFKQLMSNKFSGERNPFFGKRHLPETIDYLKTLGTLFKSGHIPWNKGKTKENDIRIQKHCEKYKGETHWLFGKKLSKERCAEISKNSLGRKQSVEIIRYRQLNSVDVRSCCIENVEYFSISEASRILNIPYSTILNRIKSATITWKNWNYK